MNSLTVAKIFSCKIGFLSLIGIKQSKFNLLIYQIGVEFSGKSNKTVFIAVALVSFMQIKTIFTTEYFHHCQAIYQATI